MTVDPGPRDPGAGELDPAIFEPEEPWEAELGSLLGALPPVDPPDGFIASALDHRPLHAGRIVGGLLAGFVVLAGAAFLASSSDLSPVGSTADRSDERNLAAQAILEANRGDGSAREWIDERVGEIVSQLGFPGD